MKFNHFISLDSLLFQFVKLKYQVFMKLVNRDLYAKKIKIIFTKVIFFVRN